MSDRQLELVVKKSGLEPSKAEVMLERFSDAAAMAVEWEARAKTIVVTDESQTALMKMAREGRLALRAKRIEIENTRKELKADVILQGKAIDGVANFLKALIVPIEKHLDAQEHFVELREKAAEEARRAEAEKLLREKEERERLEREAEERRIREENERLRKEAEERERKAAKERKAAEAKLARERKAAEAKLAAERAEAEARLAKEREEAERKAAEAAKAARAEAERKARAAAKKAREEAARREAKIQEELRRARMVRCPKCGHEFDSAEGKVK